MVTVMMQNTGRVLGADHVLSASLRASPLVCVRDTVMMIAEFMCLLSVGCSITTATRHVWYGRFEHGGAQSLPLSSIRDDEQPSSVSNNSEVLGDAHPVAATASTSNFSESLTVSQAPTHSADNRPPEGTETPNLISHQELTTPSDESGAVEISSRPTIPSRDLQMVNHIEGSSIDHNWRQSMLAFTVGAAPQALKVFAMSGPPITQVVMATYIIAFLVPEMFRLTAGSVGLVELRPMPIVVHTRKAIAEKARFICGFAGALVLSKSAFLVLFSLAQDTHVAIQVLLLVGPICMMFWIFVQIPEWLSIPHVLPSRLARIKQLWFVDLEAISCKMCCIVADVDLVVKSTSRKAPLLKSWNIIHFGSLLMAFTWTRLVQEFAHPIDSMEIPSFGAPFQGPLHIFMVNLFLAVVFASITFPWMCLLLYSVLFVGSFSKIPRRLTGIKGTLMEFIAGYATLGSFFWAFYVYTHFWTSEGTYKPAWADYLG